MFCILSRLYTSAGVDPCLTTHQITEWKRSASYEGTIKLCDTFLPEGWYVVSSNAGSMMPTECPVGGFRCGTTYSIYLSTEGLADPNDDLYPAVGETVDRIACSADFNGDCCKEKVNIKIKNCKGLYYVYYLRPPTTCPSAFCFGNNLPCPPGESSETGFSPRCGSFPNITVNTPTITSGLFQREEINENGYPMIYRTIQFQCHTNIEAIYTYDVRWYINDFEIIEAVYIDVSPQNFTGTLLHQEHWDKIFQPNMMVHCSVQIRSLDFSSPGPREYSGKFFAGIVVKQDGNQLFEGDPPKSIPVTLTIPIGCRYLRDLIPGRIKDIKQTLCVLNLLAGVPQYQNNQQLCRNGLADDTLVFESQKCGIFFSHFDYTTPQIFNVTGAADNMINFNDRLAVLQIYHDALKANTDIPELYLWNGIMLPELKFVVTDTDQRAQGIICYSNNDPHMRSFDGKRYELQQKSGEYIMYKHQRLPIMIHSFYQRCYSALCNCGAAVRSSNSLFVANFCGNNNYVTQNICNENDISVQKEGNGYGVTLPSGAKLSIGMGVYREAYIINHYTITASNLDYGMTMGLCGIFNNKQGDDFRMSNGAITANASTFADSWRIKTNATSLFNAVELQPIEAKAQEYCTCKKEAKYFPFGEPDFACNLTTAMQPCREQTIPSSVFNGRCKRVTHERLKRAIEVVDDEEPEQIQLPLNYPDDIQPDFSWKNGWTEEKAREHCVNSFQSTKSFSVCSEHVPLVPSDEFIHECIFDIQITGDVEWVDVSTSNFASACFGEAKRMENLTRTNSTNNSQNETIFDVIASSTCPKNCSGYGLCRNGECNCSSGYYGDDCSLEKSQAPILSVNKFTALCDTNKKLCQKYIVPGINFVDGNLVCRFKPFHIIFNETVDSELVEDIGGIYFGPFYMHCPAPPSRRRRSVEGEPSPMGYRLSISNDGRNFTEELTLLVYNTLCYDCNITTMICSELVTCPTNIVPVVVVVDTSNDTTYIIAGICGGISTIVCVLVVAYMAKRYRKKRCVVTSDTSDNNQLKSKAW